MMLEASCRLRPEHAQGGHHSGLRHPLPVLAAAEHAAEGAAFDPQRVGVAHLEVRRVRAAILRIVDFAAPTILVGLHVDQHGHADERPVAQRGVRVLAVRRGLVLAVGDVARTGCLRVARTASRDGGPDDKVELKPVVLGRNLGIGVEVVSGLAPSDRVINSPPDSLAAGDIVHVAGPSGAAAENVETESKQ